MINNKRQTELSTKTNQKRIEKNAVKVQALELRILELERNVKKLLENK